MERIYRGLPDDNVSNRTPISELTPGLPVFAGDFPVFITEVHGNGVFSGTGYIGIPFTKLPRITVTFSNITVNTDHRLIGGFFETKYDIRNKNLLWDADQTLTGGGGVGDIRTGEERAQFVVDCTINPDIKVKPVVTDGSRDEIKEGESYVFTRNENGKYEFIITDSKGNEHRIESETMPVTIEDKEGKTYRIDEQGNITQVSSESGIKLNPSVCYKVETDIVEVAFAEIEGVTRYAVDPYRDVYKNVTEYYQQYKAGDREIAASAKFMLPGTSDKLAVKITSSKAGFDPSKVHFVTMSGKEYEAVYMPGDKQWGITVVASAAGDGQELFAVYETEPGKYATIALLNIYTYEPKTIKVKLVPVNGFTNGFSKESVSAQLNAIYNKVGVSCEIEMASSFNYTFHDNTFNVTGSGLFSTETADMKAIKQAYNTYLGGNLDGNTLYLFIIEKVTGADGVAGDMPRGKRFGYLFSGADARTIAHEIGHGAFNLEHPFDRPLRGEFEKGQLAHCLMDYASGTEFCKLEWDAINAPGLVIGLLETDEKGMAVMTLSENVSESLELTELDQKKDAFNLYFTPAGILYALPVSAKPIFKTSTSIPIPEGALVGFYLNNKTYLANYQMRDDGKWSFIGYREKGSSSSASSFISEQELTNIINKIKNDGSNSNISTSTANYALVIGIAGETLSNQITVRIAGSTLAGYASKIINVKNFTVVAIAATLAIELFTSPYAVYNGTGVVVDQLPVTLSIAEDNVYVVNPPVAVPITIPHAIPNTKGDCQVYVIWKTSANGEITVAKYGMTCQENMSDNSDCNPRPEYQCNKFNKEDTKGFKYYYSWITPYKVPKDIALVIERSMTASYVINNNGYLPSHHYLPCFVKKDDFEGRKDKAEQWIEEMINRFGRN